MAVFILSQQSLNIRLDIIKKHHSKSQSTKVHKQRVPKGDLNKNQANEQIDKEHRNNEPQPASNLNFFLYCERVDKASGCNKAIIKDYSAPYKNAFYRTAKSDKVSKVEGKKDAKCDLKYEAKGHISHGFFGIVTSYNHNEYS